MTIVKAAAASNICRFQVAPALLVEEVAAPATIDPVVARLSDELAAARAELAAVRRAALSAVAAAREEGAREVLLDDEDRLEAVRAGLAGAIEAWNDRLVGAEALAVSVARVAVERMLGECQDLAGLVERSAAAYVARVGANSVVALRVSALDFPEAERLLDLSRSMGLPPEALTADPGLAPGECRVDLSLGHADLTLSAQWREIERLLDAAELSRERQ